MNNDYYCGVSETVVKLVGNCSENIKNILDSLELDPIS